MRFWLIIGVGALAYLFLRPRTLPILSVDAQGLVVGDSLTAHGGYQRTLAGLLPYQTWRNISEVGAGTSRVLHLVRSAGLTSSQGDAVVLLGVNDIASGCSLESIQANLAELYGYLHQLGYRVIAVTTLPWAGYPTWTLAKAGRQEQLNAWIKTADVDTVVDTSMFSDSQGRLLQVFDSGDGLHLNNAGQVELGRQIARQAYGTQLAYPAR